MTKRGKLQLILAGSAGQSSLVPPSQVKIQSWSADYGWNQCHPLAVYQSTCKLSRWDLGPVPPRTGAPIPQIHWQIWKERRTGWCTYSTLWEGMGSGYYRACELSSQDFGTCHHPQLLHYLSGLYPCNPGTKCPLLHPKHLSPTRFAGWASHEDIWMSSTGHEKLHRAQVAVLHHGDSHPAPIYRSAALSVSRSNDTHTNTVIPSWALMWLEVMAGNKSLLLVPGWIACRWVNPIANPNNMTSSLLQKQFLCNVPYSNGSASSRSE